jgi:hypothetical protein
LVAIEARAYTYDSDSDFDPKAFNNWEAVKVSNIFPTGDYFILAKNPDTLPQITYVLLRTNNLYKEITGYAYYKATELFIFELSHTGGGHYKRVKTTPEKKEFIDAVLFPYLRRFGKKI